MDVEKPENIIIGPQIAEQITKKFEGISIEDAKKIIYEVTNEMISELKVIFTK